MAQANVAFVSHSDPSITYTGAGWGLAGSGALCASGDEMLLTNAAGSFSFTFNGRAAYLLCHDWDSYVGTAAVSVDGGPGTNFCTGDGSFFGTRYRVLHPLARFPDDGKHSVVVTNNSQGSASRLSVDGLFIISGPKGTPTYGTLVTIGDSWTYGTGAQTTGGFSTLLQQHLSNWTAQPIRLIRKGVPGDAIYCASASASGDDYYHGGMYRIYSNAVPNTPEYVTFQFGVNDMRANQWPVLPTRAWTTYLHAACCFIEDLFDLEQTKVSIGTPGFIGSFYHQARTYQSGAWHSVDAYESAVRATRAIVSQFPRLRLASVYECMAGRHDLLAQDGTGLHPLEDGHALIAAEHVAALTRRAA